MPSNHSLCVNREPSNNIIYFPNKNYNKHDVILDGSLLDGVFTIKNGITGGYPFVECILSILPFCDKLLLNDGGSSDGTKECLQKIQRAFPRKVDLYYIKDKYTKNWGSIDYGLNHLIRECKSEWIFEIQGDEVLDPTNAKNMIKEISAIKKGWNAIRHSRLDYNFEYENFFYDMRTMRLVRNVPDLTSYIGGDNFQIGPESFPRAGYTLHNVPPEKDAYSFVLKHYVRCFPDCTEEWARRHAVDLASDNGNRISIYGGMDFIPPSKNETKIHSHIPNILKGLVGQSFYHVREDLFDKEWLHKTTNINYE
jgi:glycosyltransferase involved in cell wall biosynthesis